MREVLPREHINKLRNSFAQRINCNMFLRNLETGFIFCPEVNYLTHPKVLRTAAQIITKGFLDNLPSDLKPDKVVAVQSHGTQFATAIGLGADLLMPFSERRDHNSVSVSGPKVFYDEAERKVSVMAVPSVSKPGCSFDHLIYAIEPGDTLVVADDFCAAGTATNLYRLLEQYGFKLVFVYMVAKDFPSIEHPQIGYRTLKQEGVRVYAATVLKIIDNDKVIAAADDI